MEFERFEMEHVLASNEQIIESEINSYFALRQAHMFNAITAMLLKIIQINLAIIDRFSMQCKV